MFAYEVGNVSISGQSSQSLHFQNPNQQSKQHWNNQYEFLPFRLRWFSFLHTISELPSCYYANSRFMGYADSPPKLNQNHGGFEQKSRRAFASMSIESILLSTPIRNHWLVPHSYKCFSGHGPSWTDILVRFNEIAWEEIIESTRKNQILESMWQHRKATVLCPHKTLRAFSRVMAACHQTSKTASKEWWHLQSDFSAYLHGI